MSHVNLYVLGAEHDMCTVYPSQLNVSLICTEMQMCLIVRGLRSQGLPLSPCSPPHSSLLSALPSPLSPLPSPLCSFRSPLPPPPHDGGGVYTPPPVVTFIPLITVPKRGVEPLPRNILAGLACSSASAIVAPFRALLEVPAWLAPMPPLKPSASP